MNGSNGGGLNIKEMLKFQLISGNGSNGGNNGIQPIIILFLFESVMTFLGVLLEQLKALFKDYYDTNWKKQLIVLDLKAKEVAIFLEKKFDDKNINSSSSDTKVDSIIDYISKQNNITAMTYMEQVYLLSGKEPFDLTKDIQCKLCELHKGDNNLESIKLKLYSKTNDISKIREFIDIIHHQYNLEIQNKLGEDYYFFDHITTSDDSLTYNRHGNINNLPYIRFNKNKFTTNRSFDNVYFEENKEIRHRVDFFMNKKSWYDQKGIPYTLGFMFYGKPGTGKCLGRDTPILMYDGTIKKVQDIKIGEQIMGDDSTSRRILSTCKGKETLYKITPVKGDSYIVNESHILSLKISCISHSSFDKKNNRYRLRWYENFEIKTKSFTIYNPNLKKQFKTNFSTKLDAFNAMNQFLKDRTPFLNKKGDIIDISIKDYMKKPSEWKKNFKGYRVKIEFPEKIVDMDPYMIGFWIGDGATSRSAITCADKEIINYFKNKLGDYGCFLTPYNNNIDFGISSQTAYGGKGRNAFLNSLKKYNLLNNKHIPLDYKCNNRINRLKLLAGIIDSDGSLDSSNCYDIIQKSEKIIDDIIYLCRSLGFSVYKSKCQKTCTNGTNGPVTDTYFRTCVSGEGLEEIPTILQRKSAIKRQQKKDVLVTGITLSKLEIGEYYGFEIDGNHRFVLGDFTVTHNTSCIKAIANVTQRHIINISLDDIKTKTQLKSLFYDENIRVIDDSDGIQNKQEVYKIPINKRLFVLEDIDAMGSSVINARKSDTIEEDLETIDDDLLEDQDQIHAKSIDGTPNNDEMINKDKEFKGDFSDLQSELDTLGDSGGSLIEPPKYEPISIHKPGTKNDNKKEEDESDKLTLSTLLNVLDGTLEVPGRMIVVTANYPEKIDSALIRPGRIDKIVNFKNGSREIIKEMYEGFYDKEFPTEEHFDSLPDYFWSPAEINAILFKNFNNPENSIPELIQCAKTNISTIKTQN